MSILPEHPLCFNSSVYLASVCHNQGTCANETNAECECDGQYVKETFCSTTISEELNNANFPLYITIAITFFIVILLTLYDFAVDIKLKAWPTINRPIAIGKLTLFLASAGLFIHAVLDYVEHSDNTHKYQALTSFFNFFSDFLTLMTYSIATLSWISVILTAKGLGKNIKGLKYYRTYVIVANCVLLPLYLISGVFTLIFESEFISVESRVVSVTVFVFYLSLIIGTTVFIRKAYVWIQSLGTSNRTAATKRVQLKTYFLVAANAVAAVHFVCWLVTLFAGTTTASFHLYRQILDIAMVVFSALLLLILENHIIRLPLYIRTGEIRSNTFLGASSGSSSTRPAVTTQSKPSSFKMKSTTESTKDGSSVTHAELVVSRAPPSQSGEEEQEKAYTLSLGLSSSNLTSSAESSSLSSSGYSSVSSLSQSTPV
eukprot:TRINITY_DN947_c0_g2_i3.p1 TRINITY_DN947_c0_g2~~TRINITY_DN947_c0_g2_i3.p1  ORF type:complete len:443 (+),score=73.97 TRINITY_DN947_c0_g2_i3:42-1331(+)